MLLLIQVDAERAERVDAKEAIEVAALPTGEEDAESTTIYVKNLAFATTDATLRVRTCCSLQLSQCKFCFAWVRGMRT